MYLSFRNKHSNGIILSWAQCKVCDPLDTKMAPNGVHLRRLEELDFVRDDSRAVLFIVGVLEIPSGLGLLHECYNVLSRRSFPDFKVLRGIAVLLFGFIRSVNFILFIFGRGSWAL